MRLKKKKVKSIKPTQSKAGLKRQVFSLCLSDEDFCIAVSFQLPCRKVLEWVMSNTLKEINSERHQLGRRQEGVRADYK